MELSDYRIQLDEIDSEILRLFFERMDIVSRIALWKQERNLPVMDFRREQEKLRLVAEQSPEDLEEYSTLLFSFLMELSRSRQNSMLHRENEAAAVLASETLFHKPGIFFYCDHDASACSPRLAQLMGELSALCEDCENPGICSEVE